MLKLSNPISEDELKAEIVRDLEDEKALNTPRQKRQRLKRIPLSESIWGQMLNDRLLMRIHSLVKSLGADFVYRINFLQIFWFLFAETRIFFQCKIIRTFQSDVSRRILECS